MEDRINCQGGLRGKLPICNTYTSPSLNLVVEEELEKFGIMKMEYIEDITEKFGIMKMKYIVVALQEILF